MAHRLLIEVDYSLLGDQYSRLLQKWEMPRGSTIRLVYYVTNLSQSYFSGKIKDISTSFNETSLGPSSIVHEYRQLMIRALPPGQRTLFYQTDARIYSEGRGWFRVVIESDDHQLIEYFVTAEGPSIGTREWQFGFDVINREQLEIIMLLKEISAKIH